MSLIWHLSSLPGDSLPIPSGFDKAVHVVAFGILGYLLGRGTGRSRIWLAFAVAVAYGALDEWHQSLVPLRVASAWDAAADAVGSLAGVSLAIAAHGKAQTGASTADVSSARD